MPLIIYGYNEEVYEKKIRYRENQTKRIGVCHLNTNEQAYYRCWICDTTFPKMAAMKAHLNSHEIIKMVVGFNIKEN